MGWRAASPAPSLPQAPSNRNLLQCCGERRGRGARGLAGCGPGGLASQSEGGRARAGAACSPARSLTRSLPPSLRRWVSQSVSPPAAGGPASRRGPESRRRRLLLPLFVGRLQRPAQEPGPRGPPVRRGGCDPRAGLGVVVARSCPRGDGPGGRGGAAASLSAAPRRPRAGGAGSRASARRRLRGCSRDAAGLSRRRRGLAAGELCKVGLGVCF